MTSICLINAFFPPYEYGGAENHVLRTAKGLQNDGLDVSVISTKPFDGSLKPEQSNYEGIDTYYFYPANISYRGNGTGSNPVSKAIWHQIDTVNPHSKSIIKNLLNKIDPDVVHTHNLMGISTAIGNPIQKHTSKHVHTLHDYSLICPKSNLMRDLTAPDGKLAVCENPPLPCKGFARMKRHVLGSPDIITAPSNHIIKIHKDNGFFKETECRRLQLGVENIAESVPEPPDEPALLYVGKHLEAKGLDTLYKAASELPNVTFHICGSGPYDSKAKKHAQQFENIRYHGYVEDERLDKLRRKVSAAVVPSIWMENSPLTIYESFGAGLPVIGSNIGGIPELIEDGETGWLFEPGNTNDLIETIETNILGADNRELRCNALEWANIHSTSNHIESLKSDIYMK